MLHLSSERQLFFSSRLNRRRTHPGQLSIRADAHLGSSSQSASRKERKQDQCDAGASTSEPATAAVSAAAALQPAAIAAAPHGGGDSASLAHSQAVYQQHLRLLLLQTLQWNNCATAEAVAASGTPAGTIASVRRRLPVRHLIWPSSLLPLRSAASAATAAVSGATNSHRSGGRDRAPTNSCA